MAIDEIVRNKGVPVVYKRERTFALADAAVAANESPDAFYVKQRSVQRHSGGKHSVEPDENLRGKFL